MQEVRVAVIGAGAAGLACARIFQGKKFSFKVFESFHRVGGTWCVDRSASALYHGLRTNLPTKLMAFPDFPFDEGLPSFVRPKDMDRYLTNYAETFHLNQHVEFEAPVQTLKKLSDEKWHLTYRKNDVSHEELFDVVVVANGHFNRPYIPPNLKNDIPEWKGEVLHSKNYREPERFRGKRVVVVGALSSGTDIARELVGFAKEIHVCDTSFPRNNQLQLKEVNEGQLEIEKSLYWRPKMMGLVKGTNHVRVAFGPNIEADIVIFCTGYIFDFEFLPGETEMERPTSWKTTLYKHLVDVHDPSLYYIGLNQPIVPFPFFHIQAQWIAHFVENPKRIPDFASRKKDMDATNEREKIGKGVVYVLSDQWEYLLDLAKEANLPNLAELESNFNEARSIYKYVGKLRPLVPGAPDDYRNAKI